MDTSTQNKTPEQSTTADAGSHEKMAADGDRAHLHAALKEFSTVMLVTYDKKGKHPHLHAQPMRVAKLEDDCSMVFITNIGSEKVEEAAKLDGHITAQSMLRQISLNGTYEISQDRKKMGEVWSIGFNVWFPGGKDDPNACLITFHPRDAELWDASGLKGLKYLVDSAKALITKTPPEANSEQHATMKLHRD